MSRDPVTEKLLRQLYEDSLKLNLIRGQKIFGSVLDPVWLWPQEPIELRRGQLLRGRLEACDLHLHNLKSIQLVEVEGDSFDCTA